MKKFEVGQQVKINIFGGTAKTSWTDGTYIGVGHSQGVAETHIVKGNNSLKLYVLTDGAVQPVLVKKEGWVNIYRKKYNGATWNSNTHESEAAAIEARTTGSGKVDPEWVATTRIEWEE